jgi:diguanylate cyclase (GGDEF)-like protein
MRPAHKLTQWFKNHPAVYQWGISLTVLALYVFFYDQLGESIRIPAGIFILIPVMVSVWLNGKQAWIIFVVGLLLQLFIALQKGHPVSEIAFERGGIYEASIALMVMVILIDLRLKTRGLKKQTTDQTSLLGELHAQTAFLSQLGDIISAALEANDTPSILQVLANRTGELFGAHDCYITFWDEESRQTLPQVAYGGLSEIYQDVHQIQNGEYTLTAAVMDAGHAIAIENVKETDIISRNVAEEFPNISALGLPLIAGARKLGTLILGFNVRHAFTADEIARGELVARQISLAITKAFLLEEERKRTRQLDTLLALAIESTKASSEQELIARATRLIGEKLYPDNFGILILDEPAGMLRVHPSYESPDVESPDIPIGQGITGRVARTGLPCRVGDVSQFPDYLCVDPRIKSELCVPLKLAGWHIGVVNVESTALNAFTADDENLLTIMAGQLATTMGRLRADDESYRQASQLARANNLIRILVQVGTRAAAASDPDRLLQTLGTELEKLNLLCLVSLLSPDGKELSLRYTTIPQHTIRLAERVSHMKLQDYRIPLDQADGILPTTREPILLHNPVEVAAHLMKGLSTNLIRRAFVPHGSESEMPVCILPLSTEGGLLGYLWLWGEGLQESDLPTMSVFAYQIASALQNASLLVKVQHLAVTDELTGLYNRRYFFDIAGKEFERAKQGEHPMSILIIDLDHFKQFNDKYGHMVGDQVLRGAAQLMHSCVRTRDVIGRYGGEEFSIALPGTEAKDAARIARRFLSHVADTPIQTDAGELSIHISIGIASLQADVQSLTELINQADQAMYKAKSKGGNRFVAH